MARSAILVGALTVALVGMVTAFRAAPEHPRAAIARRVASTPPTVRMIDGKRVVLNHDAPEVLLPDTQPPALPAQLLWLDGRRTALTLKGSLSLDGAGGVVEFDDRLQPHSRLLRGEGREWLSVSAGTGRSLWLTDATGALLSADSAGIVSPASTKLPFAYPDVVNDRRSGNLWLVRSSQRFTYQFAGHATALLAQLDVHGEGVRAVGTATLPQHVLLEDLANAGQVAVGDGVVFYAPFIRDQLIAMTFAGDTLWVASRGLSHTTNEPRFELQERRAVVDYHPVNLGVTLGPDGRVYVLSTASVSTVTSRLDVFDPATGYLVRTAMLPTSMPTLASDTTGRVYLLDGVKLVAGIAANARESLATIELPMLDGGRYDSRAMRGRVQLLNLWASWCAPCREEMPALDSLRQEVRDDRFQFVAINEDADTAAAARFLHTRGFSFAVALGLGGVRHLLHAAGLPVTILVDREGREVHRWTGYSGAAQIESIRSLIRLELDRVDDGAAMTGMHHHGM